MAGNKGLTKEDGGLYLITDRKLAPDGDIVSVVEDALKAGVRLVQLREKDLSGRELLTLAKVLRAMTRAYGAKLFINERVDIALMVQADGVHLGVKGIPPRDARVILGDNSLIGVSAHSLEEALKAEEGGADFITIGPLYFTPSKAAWGEPVGIKLLKEVKKKVNVPVFGIGGINKDKVKEVVKAGAFGVAVISAVVASKDVKKSAISLLKELKQSGK